MDLPKSVEELQALLLNERQERDRLVDNLSTQAAEYSSTIQSQRKEIEKQQQQIIELLAAMRGKKREHVDPDQLLLFSPDELQLMFEEKPAPRERRRRKGHGRRRLPAELPREEILHELPEHERLCPHDGQPMQVIGYETSEQLEYIPAKFKVLVHKRAKYACAQKHDEAKLLTAPKPFQPIDRGLPGPGLLATVTVSKFGDHLPGYRLEDIFSRHNVHIRRSTIYGWLASAADLCESLVDRMKQKMLSSKVVHTDDTSVKLIDPGNSTTKTARFWAYIGDGDHPYTVYDFTENRGRDGPQQFLGDYAGYLQADAYGGYDGIYLKSQGAIVEVACWTHCRRYWWKAREQDPPRAHYVLAVIRQLYDVERAAAEVDTNTRQAMRSEHAAPLLAQLESWLAEQEVLPQSLIGKAFTYTRNQWSALNRYLEDGDLSIDNNISERTVKPIAIGRKNWLFVGSLAAGKRAAILMSLIASCKANKVEPWAYLNDLFQKLPAGADLESLLPDNWLQENPTHRWVIDDQRAKERAAKGGL